MRYRAVVAVLVASVAVAAQSGEKQAAKRPVLTRDVVESPRFRVVAARFSPRAGKNLEIRVVPEKGAGEARVLGFPNHSFTTHETTLMRIVRAGVDWEAAPDASGWQPTQAEVVLSIPTEPPFRVVEYESWWLVSFECAKGG